MYAWLYPVYELACAYSTQTFVFRDLLIQLFLPPDPRLIHDWEVDFTRAPVAFESVWLKITIINRKKSEGGGEDVISNTRQVDKSADEGVGEGGASQCWWNPRARLRLCPGHPSLPLGSTSPSSRWFKSSVEQNAGFSGTIAQKQTAQAIVIVSLNDVSLKWLWKRVKNHPAKSFKTWYRTWGESLVSADTSDPRLDPPKSNVQTWLVFYRFIYMRVYWLAQPSGLEVQSEPPGYSFSQAWLGETSPERVRRRQLAEKQKSGVSASECTAETDWFFL